MPNPNPNPKPRVRVRVRVGMYDISLSYMMYLPVSHCIPVAIILRSAFFCVLLRSAFCVLRSAFCVLRSAFCVLLRSAFCVLRSAFCVLRSAFCILRSAFCKIPLPIGNFNIVVSCPRIFAPFQSSHCLTRV